jgi:hypothetical protein
VTGNLSLDFMGALAASSAATGSKQPAQLDFLFFWPLQLLLLL